MTRELFGVELPRDILSRFSFKVGRHGVKYPDMTCDPKNPLMPSLIITLSIDKRKVDNFEQVNSRILKLS